VNYKASWAYWAARGWDLAFRGFLPIGAFSRAFEKHRFHKPVFLAVQFPLPIVLALMLNEVRVSSVKRSIQNRDLYAVFHLHRGHLRHAQSNFSPTTAYSIPFTGMFGAQPRDFPERAAIFSDHTGLVQRVAGRGLGIVHLYGGAFGHRYGDVRGGAQSTACGTIPAVVACDHSGHRATIIIFAGPEHRFAPRGLHGQILLLFTPITYETADVFTARTYTAKASRAGISAFTTAVGLAQSVVNLLLLVATNYISKKRPAT
jgi:putative aldouronate transport system permease protein